MKIVLSSLMALGMVLAPVAAPTVSLASSEVAIACPADAPEAWKRPGGYCEQIQNLNSIAPYGTGEGCKVVSMGIAPQMIEGRVQVATLIDPCCNYGSLDSVVFEDLPQGILPKSDALELGGKDPCYP
jgi:hypothetical protein